MHRSSTVSRLTPADHRAIRDMLSAGSRSHVHFDWRELNDWLAEPDFVCWTAMSGQRMIACVAATPDSGGVAWLRIITVARGERSGLLDEPWAHVQRDLLLGEIRPVAILAFDRWIEGPLRRWGFARTNAVVTLQYRGKHQESPPPTGILMRKAEPRDLPAVAEVDAAAFAPLWRHDEAALKQAQSVAATFVVAELDRRIVGYQLSTQHGSVGHLARLAVDPRVQGRGIGSSLVSSALTFFAQRGVREVSVNTQRDNLVSQRLYRRMGFARTTHSVPVWTLDLATA